MTLQILGGRFRHRHLVSPKGLAVRPSTGRLREALFNICQHIIEGADFLDLFAGSGAMGLEALSRGAKQATFVESERAVCAVIKDNIRALMVDAQATVLQGDVMRILERFGAEGRQFSLIFADPPYAQEQADIGICQQLVKIVDSRRLLKAGGRLFIEQANLARGVSETCDFQYLQLKDERCYGRSILQQWVLNDENTLRK